MLEPKRLRTQVASIVEPDDIHVSWFDISNPDAPVLKIYYDGAWRPIGGGGSPSGTAESTANKVTEISAESTDVQYPSAKAVYTALQSSAPADIFFSGTHAEVKGLRDSGTLVPGALYKITDYVATTTQVGTQSANHPFDIIVRATAPDTLSEEALAAPHDGDTYFTGLGAKLEAWRLMYCIDNDTNRFEWADATNGKGVIYRMIDEWGNDVPYDFKGILILRVAGSWANNAALTALAEDTFGTQTPGDKYLYLFSAVDSDGNILDASSTRISAVIEGESGSLIVCVGNVFAACLGSQTEDGNFIYCIAANVFLTKISDEDHDHVFGVMNNTFGGYVEGNTCRGYATLNTFDGRIGGNTFGGGMNGNIFGGMMFGNVFSEYMEENTFSGQVEDNVFSGQVQKNTFSGMVSNTVFPGNMMYCTFSGAVFLVTFQAVQSGGFSNCHFEGDLGAVTIAATGTEPPVAAANEFSQLRFVGRTKPNAAQTISVQKRSMTEQVIAADPGGILHVFTPWIPDTPNMA